MILKNFIVFEGIDGAGTSTQIDILKNSEFKDKFFFTAEPTNAETGKFLRKMLKGDVKLDARTSAYLFAADRCEHLWGESDDPNFNGGIVKQCENGKIVVSDRYFFSSLTYQSVTCGEELPKMLQTPFPLPEILFFFEIDPEISLKRIGERETREIFEKVDFLKDTEERYKKVVAQYENSEMKIVRIDATKSKEEVAEIIWKEISQLVIDN